MIMFVILTKEECNEVLIRFVCMILKIVKNLVSLCNKHHGALDLCLSLSVQVSYLFFKLTAHQHVYMYIRTAISIIMTKYNNNFKACVICL